ncbi:proliferating cell nuclear antigen (pcna) [Candidatus Woesearchaeota archaeon]|nr:proliferating cell nuclear antigen (pcna) [Candidatus Woesearchaeota archaeon]
MKLTLADAKYFKDSIAVISDLVVEVNFKITPDSIELTAMDPANVAMVIYKLMGSTFTEYDVKEPVTIGINLNNLKQVLKRAKANDQITLEVEKNKLKVTFQGTTKRTFQLPLLPAEESDKKEPDLKFNATIIADSSLLNDAIEDADIVAESVSFEAEPKKLTIQASGDNNKLVIEVDPGKGTEMDVKDKARAKYSIEYLKKMISGAKLSDKVKIQFSKDYPLRLEYVVKDAVQLVFILAPRVDND